MRWCSQEGATCMAERISEWKTHETARSAYVEHLGVISPLDARFLVDLALVLNE
jgi:hypothetical protein